MFFLFPSHPFSSPSPNELVLITPVDTAADFKPRFLFVPLVCLPVVFLCDWFALLPPYLIELQIERPQSSLALQFLFLSATHQPEAE